jgi:hypothetical protein
MLRYEIPPAGELISLPQQGILINLLGASSSSYVVCLALRILPTAVGLPLFRE